MSNNSDLFDTMVREASEEVGSNGWRTASQNAVTLAAIGMMANKLNKRINSIVRPAWIIAVSLAGSALWYILSNILGV
ncbi:hypothetical protein ES703_94434 [subsurface metagenome]